MPPMKPITQPTQVTVTVMSEPQFEPWRSSCPMTQPMKPNRTPEIRPVAKFWWR